MAENPSTLSFDSFIPRCFLRNRHAMTIAGNFLPRKSDLPAPEECLYRVDADTQVYATVIGTKMLNAERR